MFFFLLEDVTELILYDFKERWPLWRVRDKACHSLAYTCHTASKRTLHAFRAKLLTCTQRTAGVRAEMVKMKRTHGIHDDCSPDHTVHA